MHKLSNLIPGSFIRLLMFALVFGFGAAVALAQTRGYVTNAQDNTVSVIDVVTDSVVDTVPVGSSPADVAVTPNGRFVYVVNTLGNTVSVISAANNTVVATVPVATFPQGIAITPNGAFAYVTSSAGSAITVISTATNTVTATISLSSLPFRIAIAPNGLAYVTHGAFSPSVTVINTATNTVVANIPVPVDTTIAPAVTPNGAFVYVTCLSFSTGSKLAVIDTAANSVAAIVPLPAETFAPDVAIGPNGARAYVANNGNARCCGVPGPSSVSVIDTASNTEIANVPVGSPNGIAVTPDGARVYITNLSNNTVSVITTDTNSPFDVVSVGSFPHSIAFGVFTEEPVVDPIESLIDKVEALIAVGALTQEQGAGLLGKIQEIVLKIDAGQTSAACNQLSSFINQVNGFINNGSLTAAQGQELIDGANAVKTKVGCG